jgi:hypothetical protein
VAESDDDIRHAFDDVVNMTPKELERWLETDESKAVGWGDGESVGHESGRRIVAIKAKRRTSSTTPTTSTCATWSDMRAGTWRRTARKWTRSTPGGATR